MKKVKAVSLYWKQHVDKNDERLGQFLVLAEKYKIKSALYPGSYVHITPSLVYPILTYIDTDKRASAFFGDSDIYEYISKNKIYKEKPEICFHAEDYRKSNLKLGREFDLLISQYAGFVSQYSKKHLRIGGLLLVNNSHGDASMASIDDSYNLVSVINKRGDKYTLSEMDLDSYFVPKKSLEITKEYIEKIGRGIGYTKSPAAYVFKRIG
jgi:hypothetical protein